MKKILTGMEGAVCGFDFAQARSEIELEGDGSREIAGVAGRDAGAGGIGDGAGGAGRVPAGTAAGGLCVSGEEHDGLFSAGDVDCDQRSVVGVDVCGGEDEEVVVSTQHSAFGNWHLALGIWCEIPRPAGEKRGPSG